MPEFERSGSLQHDCVFFHHEGNRALRKGDWKVVSAREDNDSWELYNLANDRCEQVNLATQQPAILQEMVELWLRRENEFRSQSAVSTAKSPP